MSEENDEKPPGFKRWSGWYWLLMIMLAVQIVIYLFITSSFS